MTERHYNYTPYHYTFNNPILFIDPIGLDTTLYVIDKAENPDNKRVYTATIYVDVDGEIVGSYRGSSYPNAPDSNNEQNTADGGKHKYNNESGHKGGSEKGLNVVDENGSRTNTPGKDTEGNSVTMEYVNIHSGVDPENNNGLHNRGSAGCITIHPDDWAGFASNFNWNGSGGTTGTDVGEVYIYRGNTSKEVSKKVNTYNAQQNNATYDPKRNVSWLNK